MQVQRWRCVELQRCRCADIELLKRRFRGGAEEVEVQERWRCRGGGGTECRGHAEEVQRKCICGA
jgi:hypothetical protein